jgi:hypothetical protein
LWAKLSNIIGQSMECDCLRIGEFEEALELLSSDRYLEKGMGLMALTGRRPAEIFFS